MIAPILQTKLCSPILRRETITRRRLLERLNAGLRQGEGFARRLTLVSAPAGFGKTTLVGEWVQGISQAGGAGSTLRTAWLSLDEADNDPLRFLAYVIAALEPFTDQVGQTLAPLLASPQPPPEEVLMTVFLNQVAVAAAPILLVLDDYHVIHTPLIHQRLAYILDHQPANLHLVIITREDPLLPVSRLRARNQILEIRQVELCFTEDEAALFLRNVMGLSLSTEQITALERRTEGWIAGLQLAALSMQGSADAGGFIQAFTGSNRFVLDYLVDEVFERQPAEIKDFLLKTSILERLSEALCDGVVEISNSQAVLEMIEQANLFIVPLDQELSWFRYHRLFAELLQHRLRLSGIDSANLHRRASLWFEHNSLMSEAIRHALAAQDWQRAAMLIQQINSDYLKRGEVLTVIGWFQALPEEMLFTDPKLSFEYCWSLLLAGRYDLAAPLLERLEQVAQEIPAFLGEILAAQAYLARATGNHERMVVYSQRALELLPKSSLNSRGIVALNLGLAYWHMGKMQAAELVLAEALEAARATGNLYAGTTAMIFLGRVLAVRGQLRQAADVFHQAIDQGGEMPINVLAHMDLAALHYEWNELERSDRHLQKALALCLPSHNDEFLAGCYLMESSLRIAQGNLAGAEAALDKVGAQASAGKISPSMAARLDAARVHFLLAEGEPVEEWNHRLVETADFHPFYRFLGVTKAWTMPESKAQAYLAEIGKIAQTNEWTYGLVAARAFQAALAHNQDEALAYLTEALNLGESGGFVRTFVDLGKKLIPHLRAAAARGIYPAYVERIHSASLGETAPAHPSQESLIEPLSERELEVLRLVTAGLSNREIAEKLFISTGTAKSHIHNLCGKLGVRNRTEAAMKAKELSLV